MLLDLSGPIEALSVERLAEVREPQRSPVWPRLYLLDRNDPARAIERLRVEAARPMVEDSRRTFEEIARLVGFADPDRMRQSFIRTLGHTPLALRRLSRKSAPLSPSAELR